MLDFGCIYLPHLTDEGAKAFLEGYKKREKATENLLQFVPSQATTLAITGGLFILGMGYLALEFYRELRKDDSSRPAVSPYRGTCTPSTCHCEKPRV